jgi:hypothetical protein
MNKCGWDCESCRFRQKGSHVGKPFHEAPLSYKIPLRVRVGQGWRSFWGTLDWNQADSVMSGRLARRLGIGMINLIVNGGFEANVRVNLAVPLDPNRAVRVSTKVRLGDMDNEYFLLGWSDVYRHFCVLLQPCAVVCLLPRGASEGGVERRKSLRMKPTNGQGNWVWIDPAKNSRWRNVVDLSATEICVESDMLFAKGGSVTVPLSVTSAQGGMFFDVKGLVSKSTEAPESSDANPSYRTLVSVSDSSAIATLRSVLEERALGELFQTGGRFEE